MKLPSTWPGDPQDLPPDSANRVPGATEARLRRITHAMNLRASGMTYQQIADGMGVAYTTVYHYIKQGLKELREYRLETAEEYVEAELDRLEYLDSKLRDSIEEGDWQAIAVALRISESRRRLLGLDAVQNKLDLDKLREEYERRKQAGSEMSNEELVGRLAELQERLKALPATSSATNSSPVIDIQKIEKEINKA